MKTGYLGVRIEEDVEKKLNGLSEKTHVPKSFYVSEALKAYLEEIEDCEIAFERLRDGKDGVIKSENFWREARGKEVGDLKRTEDSVKHRSFLLVIPADSRRESIGGVIANEVKQSDVLSRFSTA